MPYQWWFGLRYVAATAVLGLLTWGGPAGAQTLGLQPVASGFANPVALANAGDGSMRLFIVEQAGTIRIYNGSQVLATPFLDITTKVLSGGERGLLGLAFDSNFAANGFFYVFYTSQPAGEVTIARYSVSSDPDVANASSEIVLKTQAHATFGNHNGGSLLFGPDGCLYAGIGDGGSGGDPDSNGQNLGTLLGKIIRISPSDGSPCAAAPGNPFVGVPGARGEIWALGLRNPWRMTFDPQTGDLLIGDVGQGAREEVDFQPAGSGGRNYCWKRKEGTLIFAADVPCTAGTPTDPILEYAHTAGNCSITGGYRYRGEQFSVFAGTYFYGDFCSGRIWGATESGGAWTTTELLDTTLSVSSFGEDERGEVYVVDLAGAVFRLVVASQTLLVSPPTNIAASGDQGGAFSPSSFSYSLSSTTGSVDYSISGVPSWLTASATTSGMATTAPTTVTFTVNANANFLSPGTYAITITFTNRTNGQGTQTRTARLTVNASVISDFDADRRSDILWRNVSGSVAMWLMNGAQPTAYLSVTNSIPNAWKIIGLSDFDGDKKSDILWRYTDGSVAMWLMNGAQPTAYLGVTNSIPNAWRIIGTCDFNGDGKSDILWRYTDGSVAMWLMNGARPIAQLGVTSSIPNAWEIVGLGDFNGDGKCDFLWRYTDGSVAMWLMDGAQPIATLGVTSSIPNAWQIIGVGDFNADGKSDILWRYTDGSVAMWLMNGNQATAQLGVTSSIPNAWQIIGIGDFNGDGRADFLWRYVDGSVAMWLMNGARPIATLGVTNSIPNEWKILGVTRTCVCGTDH